MHTQMNKNAITNTNYKNVKNAVNSTNTKSMSPNIFNVLSNKEIPSLAEGGFVESPTIAQVGDAKTPGGKTEGEMVIAPSKLPEILAETNVIEKTQNRTIEKIGEIKSSPTRGLTDMANDSLTTNADARTNQEMSMSSASASSSAPVVINQAAQQTQSAPATTSVGGQKVGMSDLSNISLPRWRSRLG